MWFECPSVSRAAEAKVAGVGNGVAGITDSVNPVTTCPGSILKDSIHIHSMRMLYAHLLNRDTSTLQFLSKGQRKSLMQIY